MKFLIAMGKTTEKTEEIHRVSGHAGDLERGTGQLPKSRFPNSDRVAFRLTRGATTNADAARVRLDADVMISSLVRNEVGPNSLTRSVSVALILLLWAAGIVTGLGVLTRYTCTPGPAPQAPLQWPRDTSIPLSRDRPTLVLAVHPHCPCTRATLGELAVVMRYCLGRVDTRVLFYRPSKEAESWAKTDLWETASQIPGVTARADADGAEIPRFGAVTSGAVALYNPRGELLFTGGITAARGHAGANDGRNSVIALINHGDSALHQTSVYGCPLLDDRASRRSCDPDRSHPCQKEPKP